MKVIKPWSGRGLFSRGYKGSRRAKGHQPAARVGKHRRGSGFFPKGKALSPLTDRFRLF